MTENLRKSSAAREEMLHKISAWVHTAVSGKRRDHTLAVAEECKALAHLFNLSEEDGFRLQVAGLLHDCTKEKTKEEQCLLCQTYAIDYPQEALRSPKVFHAWTGAALAGELFPEAADELVCRAIRSHTTGSEEMNLLDRLLYLADYIEPTRTFEDCITLRTMFYRSISALGEHPAQEDLEKVLEKTLLASFDMTIRDLLTDQRPIFTGTVRSRNALLS